MKLFSPYKEVKDVYPEGREAGTRLVQEIRKTGRSGASGKGFIYVNNRFEGNALETIAAIVEKATLAQP